MENVPARTLDINPAGHWFAAAGLLLGRVWSAARAFGGALHKEPVRPRRALPKPAPVPRPSPGMESGELPETYGHTKVVAMVVSPYMIHVYWDLSAKDQARSGPAKLRFHDTTAGGSFDVNVDLHTKNWYVHLWSPEKRYSIELGLQNAGAFVPLARSNPIETPRAWPVATVGQISDLPAPAPSLSQPPPADSAPAAASVPLAPSVLPAAAVPPAVSVDTTAPSAPAPPPILSVPAEPAAQPVPPPAPPNALETLRRRLSELYGFRRWPRPATLPESSPPDEPAPALPDTVPEALVDLTARIETQFSPGLSSAQFGLAPRKKPAR